MATNGFVKFLTSAKAIGGILIVLVGLVVWFVTMKENVKAHSIQLKANTPKIQTNKESFIGIKKDVEHISKEVGEIRTEQRANSNETRRQLDRIYDKVK